MKLIVEIETGINAGLDGLDTVRAVLRGAQPATATGSTPGEALLALAMEILSEEQDVPAFEMPREMHAGLVRAMW